MRWPERPYPTLTQRQREYVFGAVLGDDSLVLRSASINGYLKTIQSVAHQDYLIWKYEIMKDHTLMSPKLVGSRRKDRIHWGVRFHTRATPDLTVCYRLCYPNGRKTVSNAWLNQLTAFSLAVWYMDDGSYAQGRDFCMLYTGAFTYREQRLLQRYLHERWRITDFVIQRNRQQWCLRFTRRGTQQLLAVIEPFIPLIPSMEYKLGGPNRPWKRSINELMNHHANAWRPSQDAFLTKHYGDLSGQDIAKHLGRTLNAVYLRANKLGLEADQVSDGYGIYSVN